MSEPTLMFAGGGTGGHIYPGIAIADYWVQQYPNSCLVFVGSGRTVESEILTKTAYLHEVVPFESPRMITRHPLRFFRNWRGSIQIAREYLAKYQPDIVIGLGGFASYPIVREAARRKIPVILLEQNVIPGRATTFLSRWADCLCVTYDQTHQYFSRRVKIKTTGNPVRQEIIQLAHSCNKDSAPLLLIQGGSQGSELINQSMLNYLLEDASSLRDWELRHQTGATPDNKTVAQLIEQYKSAGVKADVRPYFSSPVELYQSATLAICRAGGTTLAELNSLQLPAIIIPISDSIRNHQVVNALHHVDGNTGCVVQENTTDFQNEFNKRLHSALSGNFICSNENISLIPPVNSCSNAVIHIIREIEKMLR